MSHFVSDRGNLPCPVHILAHILACMPTPMYGAWSPGSLTPPTPPTPGSSVSTGSGIYFNEQALVQAIQMMQIPTMSSPFTLVEPQPEPEPVAIVPLQPHPLTLANPNFISAAVADIPPPPPRFWLCHTNGRPLHIIRLTEFLTGTRELQMVSNHHGRRQLTDDHGQWEHLGDDNQWIHLQYRWFTANSLRQCVEVFCLRHPRAQNVWVEYTQEGRQGIRVYLDRSLATPQDESVFIEHVWQSIL